MNPEDGKLIDPELFAKLPKDEQEKLVPVNRDLTEQERLEMQIKMYSPCGCGSGQKFKFCCHKKP